MLIKQLIKWPTSMSMSICHSKSHSKSYHSCSYLCWQCLPCYVASPTLILSLTGSAALTQRMLKHVIGWMSDSFSLPSPLKRMQAKVDDNAYTRPSMSLLVSHPC